MYWAGWRCRCRWRLASSLTFRLRAPICCCCCCCQSQQLPNDGWRHPAYVIADSRHVTCSPVRDASIYRNTDLSFRCRYIICHDLCAQKQKAQLRAICLIRLIIMLLSGILSFVIRSCGISFSKKYMATDARESTRIAPILVSRVLPNYPHKPFTGTNSMQNNPVVSFYDNLA